MSHDQLVFEAVSYRRNTGTTLGEVRSYLQFREYKKHTRQQDHEVLCQLEKAGTLIRVDKKWFFTPAGYRQARGRALEPKWEPEDPWILLAALYNYDAGEIPLWRMLATADVINHSIPTLKETHGALNRLVAGGLLTAKREMFRATTKAVELFEKVQATSRRSMLDQLNGLQRILDCPCCGVTLKAVRWTVKLDSPSLDAAMKTYGEASRTRAR